ncbi:MAG TPA: replicative DNA helicase [Pseudomonadales bacterium]|nr:replicative DNA helicase [Pseudomonadales bacterium]
MNHTKKQIKAPAIIVNGVPPSSIELERVVLSALLTDSSVASQVVDQLSEGMFYSEANREIFSAVRSLHNRNQPIDMLTVSQEITRTGAVHAQTWMIADLASIVVSTANIEAHARMLTEKHISREIIRVGVESVTEAMSEESDAIELLDKTERDVYAIGHQVTRKDARKVGEYMPELLKRIETATENKGITGIETGIRQFDRHTGGLQGGELYIMAGRPGMGKTALMMTWALNIAMTGIPVGVFSLEMTAEEISMRLMASVSGTSGADMKMGKVGDFAPLMDAANVLTGIPLYIDDEGAQSAASIRSRARRLVQKCGCRVIMLDYLQKMAAPPEYKGQREAEVNHNVQALKNVAKELKIPFVCLSQLSRSVETRGGSKRPMLSDLRESGAIEQEADMVLFLWRPEYYGITQTDDGPIQPGYVECDIAKFRHGPTTTIPMQFHGKTTTFTDIDIPAPEASFTPPPMDWTIPKSDRQYDTEIPF